jgi:hypothetical protein
MANVSHYFFILCGLLLIALSIYTFAYSELISEEKKNTYTNLKLILSFITSTPLILLAFFYVLLESIPQSGRTKYKI